MLPLLLLVLTPLACGNSGAGKADADDASGNSDLLGICGIRAEVAGGTAIEFTGNDDAACATLHSSGTGLDGLFIGTNAKGTLELIVDGVSEGETGGEYPTRIVVTSMAKEHWQGDGCLASITEHRLVNVEASQIGEFRHYQVGGHGNCAESLAPVPAGVAAVTLSPFTFRAQFTWRD